MMMRNALVAAWAVLAASTSVWAATSFDVAPTTLDLASGKPGLFFITNHSSAPVKVQVEPMDWRQDSSGDVRTPSTTLLVSPQFVSIAPGARQSVRLMARSEGPGEHAYRLMISELPDADESANGVKVLMQFSVPVFVDHDGSARPDLAWEARSVNGKPSVVAHNQGNQTVKLTGLTLDGALQGGSGFFYLLPGATREMAPVAVTHDMAVRARDERSSNTINAVVTAH